MKCHRGIEVTCPLKLPLCFWTQDSLLWEQICSQHIQLVDDSGIKMQTMTLIIILTFFVLGAFLLNQRERELVELVMGVRSDY